MDLLQRKPSWGKTIASFGGLNIPQMGDNESQDVYNNTQVKQRWYKHIDHVMTRANMLIPVFFRLCCSHRRRKKSTRLGSLPWSLVSMTRYMSHCLSARIMQANMGVNIFSIWLTKFYIFCTSTQATWCPISEVHLQLRRREGGSLPSVKWNQAWANGWQYKYVH